jgi:hypothetical protein
VDHAPLSAQSAPTRRSLIDVGVNDVFGNGAGSHPRRCFSCLFCWLSFFLAALLWVASFSRRVFVIFFYLSL